MATAIQAVPSPYIQNPQQILAAISQLGPRARTLLAIPGVTVSVGATLPASITYDAAGLLASVAPAISNAAKSTTPAPISLANAATAVASATPAVPTTAPAATAVTTAAGGTSANSAATIPTTSSTAIADATAATANSLLLDYAAIALDNIAGNPAYATAAAGLYMNVAVFRSQQMSSAGLPETPYSLQAVAASPAVKPV